MTTRAQLRTAARERLEDTASPPLWSDAALNGFLADAVAAYGARFPRTAQALAAAVAAGALSVLLPAAVPEEGVAGVVDPSGRAVERFDGPGFAPGTGVEQGWRVWAGAVRFRRPVRAGEAGAWTVEYRAGREAVADDVSAQPIGAGDEPIVVALACAAAVERRAVEDAKRGSRPVGLPGLASDFRSEAERLIAARRRRLRSGVVVPA